MDNSDYDNGGIDRKKRQILKAIAAGTSGPILMGSVAASKNDRASGNLPGKGRGKDGRGRGFYPSLPVPSVDGQKIPLQLYSTQLAMHPHHDRAIFTTGIFGEGFRLYVAEGVSEPMSVPSDVYRITSEPGLVAALEWRSGNRIAYDQDLVRYERKLPPSNAVFEPKVIEDPSFRGVESL